MVCNGHSWYWLTKIILMNTYWHIGNQLLIEMPRLGATDITRFDFKVFKYTHLSSFLVNCYAQVFHYIGFVVYCFNYIY